MPLTLTSVTGPIYLPNGATPVDGRVSFELSSWDQEEGEALFITGPVYSTIDVNGQFSVNLHTTTSGNNSVHYRMFVIWEDSELTQSYVNEIYVSSPTPHYTKKYIGSFALSGPGPFRISDLNIISETSNSSFDAYLEMKAFADRIDLGAIDSAVAATAEDRIQTELNVIAATTQAEAAADDRVQTGIHVVASAASATAAAASAAQAALFGGPWVDKLASYTSNAVITYGAGSGHVDVGDYILTREEGLSLKVLASGATTYTHINANGVKANLVSRAVSMPAGIGDQFTSGKYDLIGGVLRQNSADRTQWDFLNDSAHVPVGFDVTRPLLASDGTTNLAPRAAGQSLLFFFKHTTDRRVLNVADDGYYDRVVAVNAWADETLSKNWGISLGAKVTRSGLLVYGSMHKTRHGRIYWSGSAWVMTEDSLHPTDTVSVSWDSGTGVLTVTHGWLPGQNLRLDADYRATSGDEDGLVATPFIPVRGRIISDTQFTVRFLSDGSTGPGFTGRTGAEGTGMSFRWTKSYDGPVTFDGTGGWDAIPWDEGDTGNIWVQGFMRREAPL